MQSCVIPKPYVICTVPQPLISGPPCRLKARPRQAIMKFEAAKDHNVVTIGEALYGQLCCN